MKLKTLLFAVLAAAATAAQPADLSQSMILVAKPELVDQLYGSTVLVVTPVGPDQHAGFIVNRPTNVTLGQLFPDDGPSQKVVDRLPRRAAQHAADFALSSATRARAAVIRADAGLYAAVDTETVDRIISPNRTTRASRRLWCGGTASCAPRSSAAHGTCCRPSRTSRCRSRARACGKSWCASPSCARTVSSL